MTPAHSRCPTDRQPRQQERNHPERNVSQASREPPPEPAAQPAPYNNYVARDVDTEILVEKEQTINELRETVDVREILPRSAN